MTPPERIDAVATAVATLSSNNAVVQIGVIRDAFLAILDDMLERLRAEEKRVVDQRSNLAAGLPEDLTREVIRRIES